MSTRQKDLSYFRVRLVEFLQLSFPELSKDSRFISGRSQLAADAYENAFKAGNQVMVCSRIAEQVLFENLHFSKFDTIFKIVCNEFDTVMADQELHPFALEMLSICEPVFDQYELTEEFADSEEFDLLYTELTGTIQIWIEENGI
jgi:hypothetical protein